MPYNEKLKLDVGLKRLKKQTKEVSIFLKSGKPEAEDEDCSHHKHHKKHHEKHHKKHPIAQLSSIQVQLMNCSGVLINDGSKVRFDKLINCRSKAISYNAITGEFIIKAVGTYYISWWVATDGTAGPTTVTFVINKDDCESISGSSPLVTGMVIGSALITVDAKPSIITLVNKTTNIVAFAATPIQANIIITQVSN